MLHTSSELCMYWLLIFDKKKLILRRKKQHEKTWLIHITKTNMYVIKTNHSSFFLQKLLANYFPLLMDTLLTSHSTRFQRFFLLSTVVEAPNQIGARFIFLCSGEMISKTHLFGHSLLCSVGNCVVAEM